MLTRKNVHFSLILLLKNNHYIRFYPRIIILKRKIHLRRNIRIEFRILLTFTFEIPISIIKFACFLSIKNYFSNSYGSLFFLKNTISSPDYIFVQRTTHLLTNNDEREQFLWKLTISKNESLPHKIFICEVV